MNGVVPKLPVDGTDVEVALATPEVRFHARNLLVHRGELFPSSLCTSLHLPVGRCQQQVQQKSKNDDPRAGIEPGDRIKKPPVDHHQWLQEKDVEDLEHHAWTSRVPIDAPVFSTA